MDSTPYKEQYRYDMIRWGEEKRKTDPGYFCRRCTESAAHPVWIVADARRPTDMEYFSSRYNCVSVRVYANEETRKERGWIFRAGVDDSDSECALDEYKCDITVDNNGDKILLEKDIQCLKQVIIEVLCKN
jgi:phosphomevalonate kinase